MAPTAKKEIQALANRPTAVKQSAIVADVEPTATRVIYTEVRESTGYLWLDRADRSNAMGTEFFEQLPDRVTELDRDPAVRVIVIGSTSRHFSTGLDLKEMQGLLRGTREGGMTLALDTIKDLQESIGSVAACKKPVIAAINGYCIGGGVDLIACADIRLCSADATFSVRETRLAMIADLGSLQRLPAIVTRGHLSELALTGRDISATAAHEIGLVNHVYRDKVDLFNNAAALANEIGANSPTATQGVKESLRNHYDKEITGELDFVAGLNLPQLGSADLIEAVAAHLEKRKPNFRGY